MRKSLIALSLASALAFAACGSKGTSTGSGGSGTTPVTGPSGHVAIPAKATPSVSAKMVCETEVQGEIASVLGVRPNQPIVPTWKDHLYSCTYHYKGGSFTLSVKELVDKAATDAYFAGLAQKLGKSQPINGLAPEGAFTTRNKSVVFRKDYKVTLVDISKLPAKFGAYGDTRDAIALNVAATILSCWTGA